MFAVNHFIISVSIVPSHLKLQRRWLRSFVSTVWFSVFLPYWPACRWSCCPVFVLVRILCLSSLSPHGRSPTVPQRVSYSHHLGYSSVGASGAGSGASASSSPVQRSPNSRGRDGRAWNIAATFYQLKFYQVIIDVVAGLRSHQNETIRLKFITCLLR